MNLTDLHSHLMPGVDDGAQSVGESREALSAMYADGVRSIVTTPHLNGSLTLDPVALAARLEELDAGWHALEAVAADAAFAGLTVARGVELMLDTPTVDLSDPRLRLAGGPFVLLEFPFMTVPPQSARALAAIRAAGWFPIVAHPERYTGVDAELEIARQWREAGAYLQVNAASLLGRYGGGAQRIAVELLGRGWADLIASDYHARGRPRLREARELIQGMGGGDQAELLMELNPARVAAGELPFPVPPLRQRRTLLSRILGVFR